MNSPELSVLFIYYYFPPRGGVAVQRLVKLCKYLGRFGCKVSVLTSGAQYSVFRDDSLMETIPRDVEIHTTTKRRSIEGQFGRKNFVLDTFIGWVPSAIRKAEEVLAQKRIDVIVTTSPPHSQQLIGLYLKKRNDISWVADFRDPWTSDLRFVLHKTGWRLRFERLVEKIVLRHADRVIATTPGATESFYQKVRGHCSRNKFICIPNGYDPDDYPETSPGPPCDRLIFSYVGSTGEYISEPALFLRALKRAVDESPKLRNVVRVRLVGAIENRIKKLVERIGLQDIVEIRGNVAHREAIAIMTSSHVLLLFELPVTENRPTLVIPSKVFEYLGSGRLILSMVTDGDTADVLKDCPNSLRISPTDPVQMADTIKELARKFEAGTLCRATGSPPPEHTREVRAGKFAEMLHGLYDGLRKTPN